MWIYLPSTSSPSAPAPSTPSLSASSWQFQALALSVTLSETHSAPGVWFRRWKRDAWLRLLCSRMCEPSTAAAGVDAWIASLRGSRASRSRAPGSGSGATTRGTSSRTSSASPMKAKPESSGSKTYQDSSQLQLFSTTQSASGTLPISLPLHGKRETRGTVGALTLIARGYTGVYSENAASPHCSMSSASWSAMVTERRGDCSRRRKSGRLTRESGCSSWPTPDVGEVDGGRSARGQSKPGRQSLKAAASEAWPTPRSEDSESCQQQTAGKADSLTDASRMWTTPNVPNRGKESKESKESRGSGGVDLQTQADAWRNEWRTPMAETRNRSSPGATLRRMEAGKQIALEGQVLATWPTPKGKDHKGQSQRGEHGLGDALANMAENTSQSSLPAQQTASDGSKSSKQTRRLNPRFVAWLQGWPLIVGIGSEHWGTVVSRFRSRMRTELSRLHSGLEVDAA